MKTSKELLKQGIDLLKMMNLHEVVFEVDRMVVNSGLKDEKQKTDLAFGLIGMSVSMAVKPFFEHMSTKNTLDAYIQTVRVGEAMKVFTKESQEFMTADIERMKSEGRLKDCD